LSAMTLDERATFADWVRAALEEEGSLVVVYEPGDGTHYEFLLKILGDEQVVVGAGIGGRWLPPAMSRGWLVAQNDRTAILVDPAHWIDPSTVGRAWSASGSVFAMTELLNLVAGDPDGLLDEWRLGLPDYAWGLYVGEPA